MAWSRGCVTVTVPELVCSLAARPGTPGPDQQRVARILHRVQRRDSTVVDEPDATAPAFRTVSVTGSWSRGP